MSRVVVGRLKPATLGVRSCGPSFEELQTPGSFAWSGEQATVPICAARGRKAQGRIHRGSHAAYGTRDGERGAAARWDPTKRLKRPDSRNLPQPRAWPADGARSGFSLQAAIESRLVGDGIIPWRYHPRARLVPEQYIDKHWSPRLVREWEQLLDLAKADQNWPLLKDCLLSMTAISRLSPMKLTTGCHQSISLRSMQWNLHS
jgi:hypothetical protein